MIDGAYFVLSDEDYMSDPDIDDKFVIVKYDGSSNTLYVAEEGDLDDYFFVSIISLTSTKLKVDFDGDDLLECTKVSPTVKK